MEILEKDICKDLIAWLIHMRSDENTNDEPYSKDFFSPNMHPCLGNYNSQHSNIFFWGIEGYIPNVDSFFSQQLTKPVFIPFMSEKKCFFFKKMLTKFWIFPYYNYYIKTRNDIKYQISNVGNLKAYQKQFAILIKKDDYNYIFEQKKSTLPKWHTKNLIKVYEGKNLVVVSKNGSQSIDSSNYEYLDKNQITGLISTEFPRHLGASSSLIFNFYNELIVRYFNDSKIIPYDLTKKKLKFKLAFEELGNYMEKYLV